MIGFFGGTFDPIHNGHLHAARTAASALGCREMRLVLAARPGHREAPVASIEHRWAMLRLAVEGDTMCSADDREIRRPGTSFTVDTLRDARREFGATESLLWCIGWDQYRDLMSWREPEEIARLAHLVVLKRPGDEGGLDSPLQTFLRGRVTRDPGSLADGAGRIYLLSAPMLDISATTVRRRIAHGGDLSQLLPPAVATYIIQHHLYGGSRYPAKPAAKPEGFGKPEGLGKSE